MKKTGEGSQFGVWRITNSSPKRGGNSKVWEVQKNEGSGETLALKILNDDRFASNRYQRFCDEVDFVNSNPHSGILPIVDSHLPTKPTESDRPWYVMPLAKPISDLIDPSTHRLEAVVALLAPVINTLAWLHAREVAHRDIKPDNILILDGSPVLSDFGLVDFPGKIDVTVPTERVGPALFVAPELFADAEDVDGRPGDIYSFAKTLWVLAADKRWPPPGRLDIGDSRLRLSTYCSPHDHSVIVDHLLDLATLTSADSRPSAMYLATELGKWMELVSMSEDETKPQQLEHLQQRFAAIAASADAEASANRALKEAVVRTFDQVAQAVERFIKRASEIAHGKVVKDRTLYALPETKGVSQMRVTRHEGRVSDANTAFGFYCEGPNSTFQGVASQVHVVSFLDSTIEVCVSLYLCDHKLKNKSTYQPGLVTIDANPPVPLACSKMLWGSHIEEQLGSASLAVSLLTAENELDARLESTLHELQTLINARRQTL